MSAIDKLNDIFDKHKNQCDGMFHNCLWQIMVNNSLGNSEAAFIRLATRDDICIALGEGGFIPAMFGTESDAVLTDLNEQVFGLLPDGVDNVICRSLRK